MSENNIFHKTKRVIAGIMVFCSWILQSSCATAPHVYKFPFDVSKRDSRVNEEINISENRSYYFALQFNYFGSADSHRVRELVGQGTPYPNERSNNPGVIIPIHIKISRSNPGQPSESIYDSLIETQGTYAHGFDMKNQANGDYEREIIAVNLLPGIYLVEANTIKDSPEFSGTPTYLLMEWHPKIKFLPNTVNSQKRGLK